MQCKAKTNSGSQCKNKAQEGSEYCYIHAEKSDEIRHPQKKAMISALESTLGVVTTACKRVEISRDTHYRWYKEDEQYKEAVNETKGMAIDFVESQMFKQIKAGSNTLIKYYLSTQGKDRGYVERKEFDHTSGGEQITGIQFVPINESQD